MDIIRAAIVWFPFSVALSTFGLALIAVARAPKSRLVRLFSVFAGTQSVLTFIEWGYRHAPTLTSAQAWIEAGAVWPIAVPAIWAFTWATLGSVNTRREKLLAYLMYPPAVVFIVLGFVSPLMKRTAVWRWWGYTYLLPSNPLMNLALVWAFISSVIIAARVVAVFMRGESSILRVHRAFVVGVLCMIAAILSDSIVRAFRPEVVPEFSTIGPAVFVVVIGRAVSRYGMWEFAPQTAADTVLQTMGDAVIMVDDEGIVRYANGATRRLLDLRKDPVGRRALEYLPATLLTAGALGENQDTIVPIDGSVVLRASASVQPMPAVVGGRIVVLRNSEERIRYEEQLAHLAYHDALTGLGNRISFFEKLADLCHWTSRFPMRYAAAILADLDRFKEINDAYGHATGDDLLVQTAARLEDVVRSTDMAFRLGGDEFAVLVRDIGARSGVTAVAEKIIAAFDTPLVTNDLEVPVPVSVGYTVIHPADTPEMVFARIDAGLYEAKKARGCAVEFAPSEELPQTRRARLHRKVREAIPNGYLTWHYQPIVTASGTIVGGESLARWNDPDGEALGPAEFIPAAEEIGGIVAIGTESRRHAVDLLNTIPGRRIFLSVNVSPREFGDGQFFEHVLAQLESSNAVRRIHLELTETQLMELGPKQHRMFSAFADAGVKFMIDDFGTGYSSFTRLRDLPIHGVKLDRSFLVGADSDPRVRGVLEGAIQMVRGLGLMLVAEGVESRNQVDMLREAGCSHFQGYYFHHPLPPERFLEELR